MLLICCGGCTNQNASQEPICNADNCSNKCKKTISSYGIYGDYCEEHTCTAEGCDLYKNIEDIYCSLHTDQQILLTDLQIQESKQLVKEYCQEMIGKHSYILAVNLFNKEPKTNEQYIYFDCNVVREDSDTNFGTIYLYLTDDDEIKIKGLEYEIK